MIEISDFLKDSHGLLAIDQFEHIVRLMSKALSFDFHPGETMGLAILWDLLFPSITQYPSQTNTNVLRHADQKTTQTGYIVRNFN